MVIQNIICFVWKSHPGHSYHYQYADADCQKQSVGMKQSRVTYASVVTAVLYFAGKIHEAVSFRTSKIYGTNTQCNCVIKQSGGTCALVGFAASYVASNIHQAKDLPASCVNI